jgi:predicted GNAT superfamily acetyltransferase
LTTSADGLIVEDIHNLEQQSELEELQVSVWGSPPEWVVPSHMLHIVTEYGGIVLGARMDGKIVGFVLGLLGRRDGRLLHASHMMGIHPDYQEHGIGATLKWAQRDRAKAQGLDLMSWTFDPLESRNAYFNMHKLGTTSYAYRPDFYGPMKDSLNQWLPSDRLMVNWDLRDGEPRPISAPVEDAAHIVIGAESGPEVHLSDDVAGRPLIIEIPRDFQTIKGTDNQVALAWRMAVREAFQWALARGYVARDFREGGYFMVRERNGQ